MKRIRMIRVIATFAVGVHELHNALRELVQLCLFLVLTGISLGVVLVGAWNVRFWLG